jgi:hypothetical protein
VPALTLDSYCARHEVLPDVIKIDVEGAERDVVFGMHRIVSGASPAIAMEFWHTPRPNGRLPRQPRVSGVRLRRG